MSKHLKQQGLGRLWRIEEAEAPLQRYEHRRPGELFPDPSQEEIDNKIAAPDARGLHRAPVLPANPELFQIPLTIRLLADTLPIRAMALYNSKTIASAGSGHDVRGRAAGAEHRVAKGHRPGAPADCDGTEV
ncbi:MAG: hypothetical protein IH827_02735 [Myxococcales bacterium]|nr:hypothetical protein [Myxococcales bacterium]